MGYTAIKNWQELTPEKPAYALLGNVDLVVIRWPDEDQVSVLYGRCLHRGALMADGHIEGENLVCSLHGRDYRYKSGISAHRPSGQLQTFSAYVKNNKVWVDEDEVINWEKNNPQPYQRDNYHGLYEDVTGGDNEPHVQTIKRMAQNTDFDSHNFGEVAAMGVPLQELPCWSDIQIITAQLHRLPLDDGHEVITKTVIGPRAKKPLEIDIPLLVTDMSFGALSPEAKLALATGAELSGTAVCSGEGGILEEEQQANSRYFYEYAPGRFGFDMEQVKQCQAFHFKLGQATKTGAGGTLPSDKLTPEIAKIRGIEVGQAAGSPSRIPALNGLEDFRRFADTVREATGGIPIGVKLSAQHVEKDIQAAIDIGVDYIILDGRGGGSGASPTLFRDNLSVPTIPALARARKYLNDTGNKRISLIITGGLRTPADYFKALALGADAIALGNAALQAIGCIGMRACQSNKCPVGIATQDSHFRRRLIVENSAEQLDNFFKTASHSMKQLARACGREDLSLLSVDELTTWNLNMTELSGITYGGVSAR